MTFFSLFKTNYLIFHYYITLEILVNCCRYNGLYLIDHLYLPSSLFYPSSFYCYLFFL